MIPMGQQAQISGEVGLMLGETRARFPPDPRSPWVVVRERTCLPADSLTSTEQI